MKISEKLAAVIYVQISACLFAFKQDDGMSISKHRVIDFLALLRSYVGNELRDDLKRIEYVIAEDLNERHDHCILRRLLGLDYILDAVYPG